MDKRRIVHVESPALLFRMSGILCTFVADLTENAVMKQYLLPLLMCAVQAGVSFIRAEVYELSVPEHPKVIKSDHLRMGGANPQGERIDVNNFYMSMGGKPVIPVMGEFHYSRYPAEQWEDEILKMKSGGVTVLPTYVFWSLHEEQEGVYRWDGQRDLRRFLQLCKKHDMPVIVRIGPFCHGEIRSGGLPDWLFAKPLEVRSNDPEYLKVVKRLYKEIAKQMEGLYYKDGGPIIGCQVENEMQHSAAPWAICYPGEPNDFTAASYNAEEANIGVEVQTKAATGADMGTRHMKILKQMAEEAGIDVPFFTATGWGNAAVIEGEAIPVTAAYTYPFWAKPHMSPFLMFKDLTKEADYAPTRYNPGDYPSFCAEMGAGIQMIYSARPIVTAEAAEGLMVRTLGSGANGIGYYMYHGGSTPKQIGGVGSFNDEPMGMPKVSYDFQAPLGEFGLEGKMYRNLRLLHSFLADFGDRLAPMETVLPEGWERMTPENRDDLRYAMRWKDDSGFVFMINFQDHDTLRHDMEDVRLQLNLSGEKLRIPSQGGFTLHRDASVILPFNMDMNGALLKYATAQLLLKIDDRGTEHYFFFAPEGMTTEYMFDKATVRGKNTYKPVPGLESTFTVKTKKGKSFKITTLTRGQALNAVKVNGRLLIADATVLPRENGADLLSLGENEVKYVLYSSAKGFKEQIANVPAVTVTPKVKKAGPRRMAVTLKDHNLAHNANVQEYFLRVSYVGDVAMAFMKGQLVQDEFYHGAPWTIGLKRYYEDLKTEPLTFYFRPMRHDAPFLRDLPQGTTPDFTKGAVVEIRDVEVVPQYRLSVNF